MLLRCMLLVCCSTLLEFADCVGFENARKSVGGVASPLAGKFAIKGERFENKQGVTNLGLQKRNFRAYPQWFSQRIKKLVGNRFMHNFFYPSEQRSIKRNNQQTRNFRRSFYGVPSGLPNQQQQGYGPFIAADDSGINGISPQALQGAQLVDLPNNFQELPPHVFHQLSLPAGLQNHEALGDGSIIALPTGGDFLFGRHHHHNPCHRKPCLNDGVCVHHKHARNFRCSCRSGFKGHYCEIPAVSCIPNPCKNDGTCTLHDHGFFCSCPADFKGPSCSVPTACFSNPCQNGATCLELESGFKCQCVDAYEGETCSEKIDVCKNNPCKNEGVCKEFGTTFECICKEGFSCRDCSCNTTTIIKQTTISKQSSCPASACKNGAACFMSDKGYNCQCLDGFHGTDCSIPDLCKKNPCENGGVCVQVGADYKCICSYGFKGTNCHLPLSCSSHPCINAGTCHEAEIDFKCVCPLGYKGDTCQELNPCAHSPCAHSAHCIERGPFYTCICEEGYRGKDCKEKDPCHPSPCLNGACFELSVGVASCNCTGGWAGDFCELRNECFPNRCLNGGTCTHNGQSYHCICPEKYHGTSCELVNPCHENPCRNTGVCTVTESGYVCTCTDGYRGTNCEIGGHCHPNPCHHGGQCFEGDKSFICECPTGFAGQLCEVQDFCDPNPCHNNGQCTEEVGTYSCTCPFGFLGNQCEQSICLPSPCKNGGTCIASNTEHGYACECVFPYHGHDCEEWDPCIPSPCKNGGKCKSHLKEIKELHLHEGALQNLLHGDDESVVDVVEPDEDILGDNNFTSTHHPELYEEHDQATNSELAQIHRAHFDKLSPHFDSDHSDWPVRGHDETSHDYDHGVSVFHHHNQDHHIETLPESFKPKFDKDSDTDVSYEEANTIHEAHINDHPNDGEHPVTLHHPDVDDLDHPKHESTIDKLYESLYSDHHRDSDKMHSLRHDNEPHHYSEADDDRIEAVKSHHDNEDDEDQVSHHHHHHEPDHEKSKAFKELSGGLYDEILSLTEHKKEKSRDEEADSKEERAEEAKSREKEEENKSRGNGKIDKETVDEITKNVVKAVLKQKISGRLSKKNKIAKKKKKHGRKEIRKRTLQNLYVCECPAGYLGAHCQLANPCEKSPCLHGGVCLPRGDKYQCQCMSGYAGVNCEDLHPCDPNPCQNGGSCRLAHNVRGYHCDCARKFRGYQCEKINHCASGNPCQHGGKCQNTNIGIECRCRQRYGGNLCEVDKCEGCSLDAHCKQGHCVCKPGFIGNGYKCKAIGDICSPNPCENDGKCLPGQDGKLFICQCKTGFTGNRCEFFNPCQSSPCQHNGLCVDNSNSRQKGIILIEHTDYKCFCPQGYRGKNCEETSLAACSSIPCLNNATCFDSSDENHRKNLMHPDDYECFCRNGYSGKQCEIPHYGCWSHPCQNGGSCLDPSVLPEVSFDSHGYKCNCLPSYIGRNCEVTLHGATPCYSAPCLHNGRCVDVSSNTDPELKFEDLNSYKCFCNVMYSGKNCEVPFPACTSAPCYHNGTCMDGTTHPDFNFDEHGYHCLCSVGYEGKNCERQYSFASPEEEDQILHPTDTPDFELLTPTPMVVYVRPRKTTPKMGTLEKANPGVIVIKHRTTPKPMLDLPIEDISLKQAHDQTHHTSIAEAISSDQLKVDSRESVGQKPKDEGESDPKSGPNVVNLPDLSIKPTMPIIPMQQIVQNVPNGPNPPNGQKSDSGHSTVVHIVPDTGSPGGAASIVDEVPKHTSNNPVSSQMVSLVPDVTGPNNERTSPGIGRQLPARYQAAASYWQQPPARAAVPGAQSYPAGVDPARAYVNQAAYLYGSPGSPSAQTGQARSLNTQQANANWQTAYNRLLQQRLYQQRVGKKSVIPFSGRP